MEACHRWLPFSLAKSQVVPFFVVTWPPNLIISDTFKEISGPDSDEKLAPNIIDKYTLAGKPTFWCHQKGHHTFSSRLSLVGRLSPHRVNVNDPSHRASLRHPVSSLASRPSQERELAPLVHIVQAAFSPLVAQPTATPVAIRSVGEDLNPTKERTSFASGNVSDQVLVALLI